MERKKVLTLVKRNHKFGGNDFVRGRISGIAYCMQGYKDVYPNEECDEGMIYITKMTPIEYDDFINIIEKLYPGLCEFDYKMKRS